MIYEYDIFDNKNIKIKCFKIINYLKKLQSDIITDKYFYQKLCQHMFYLEYFYKCIEIMKYVNLTDDLIEININIDEYCEELFSNKDLLTKLSNCYNNITNIEIKIIVDKILLKSKKFFNKKTIIDKETKLITNLSKKFIVNNKHVTKSNFISILSSLHNKEDRILFEKEYCSQLYAFLPDFIDIFKLKYEYANENGFDTYFDYMTEKIPDINDNIPQLIDYIINNTKCDNEINKIKTKLNVESLDLTDIIYYYSNLTHKKKFSLNETLKNIMYVFNEFFGITFKKIHYEHMLWNDNIQTYILTDKDNEILGIVHFDFTSKKLLPSFFHINQHYIDINKNEYHSRMCLLFNSPNTNDKTLTYNDVVYIFKEFGYILKHITYKSEYGLCFKHNELDGLIPCIMEYIAWNNKIMKLFCSENLAQFRFNNNTLMLRLKCIYILFDYTLHKSHPTNKIHDIYITIFKDILPDINIKFIHPNILINELNTNACFQYSLLLLEIFGYSLSESIIDGNGTNFINDVLSKPQLLLKELITKYIKHLNIDILGQFTKYINK